MTHQLEPVAHRQHDLAPAIDTFFEGVLADPLLSLYFLDTDISTLKQKFVTYLAYALTDAESSYPGKNILRAHVGRDITDEAADSFADKLLNALQDANLSAQELEKLKNKLPQWKDRVVDKFVSPDTHVYTPQRMK